MSWVFCITLIFSILATAWDHWDLISLYLCYNNKSFYSILNMLSEKHKCSPTDWPVSTFSDLSFSANKSAQWLRPACQHFLREVTSAHRWHEVLQSVRTSPIWFLLSHLQLCSVSSCKMARCFVVQWHILSSDNCTHFWNYSDTFLTGKHCLL